MAKASIYLSRAPHPWCSRSAIPGCALRVDIKGSPRVRGFVARSPICGGSQLAGSAALSDSSGGGCGEDRSGNIRMRYSPVSAAANIGLEAVTPEPPDEVVHVATGHDASPAI